MYVVNSIKDVKPYMSDEYLKDFFNIQDTQYVLAYDERRKKWIDVYYDRLTNVFRYSRDFGAFNIKDNMHLYLAK